MEGNGHSESAIPAKDLFRIGEVSRLTSTKPFVLRFWETEFPMLQPVKSPKGHRLYRREDIETVFVIKRLLYDEGFTIAGARRHLRDQAGDSDGADGGEEMVAEAVSSFSEQATREQASEQGNSPKRFAERPAPVEKTNRPRDSVTLNRQTLMELRESLLSLLTALESE